MDPKIIFEDEDILVLDKPSGWIVNEAETTGNTPVLQTWLKENLDYSLSKSREARSGIVHRLDKETSGILLVAKTQDAYENLQSQFKSREVAKTYTALVHGKVEPQSGEINASVGRQPWNRKRFGIVPGGREAVTRYNVISHYSQITDHQSLFTLLELYPKTGRTHQIRVHLKYLGHPIVGDEFYAGRKTARADRKWCPRVFLHASEITFKHPRADKNVSFKSELSEDLDSALNNLVLHSTRRVE